MILLFERFRSRCGRGWLWDHLRARFSCRQRQTTGSPRQRSQLQFVPHWLTSGSSLHPIGNSGQRVDPLASFEERARSVTIHGVTPPCALLPVLRHQRANNPGRRSAHALKSSEHNALGLERPSIRTRQLPSSGNLVHFADNSVIV
jgi:hypothetical protein